MAVGYGGAAAMRGDEVIRKPAPLAVAVPDEVFILALHRGFAITHRALDAQAEVLTELANVPIVLKVLI